MFKKLDLSKLHIVLSSFFFLGFIKVVPGTFGTLGGAILYYFIHPLSLLNYFIYTCVLFFVGTICAQKTGEYYKSSDDRRIVIDEVVGFLLTMLWIDFSIRNIIMGFIIFRIYDITKPSPANTIDRYIKNSWGVMLDDVIAALYANATLRLLVYLLE